MLDIFARNWYKSTFTLLALLVLSIIVIYYPSLSVPFYLDDRESIVQNPIIQAQSLDLLINSWMRMRIIGYFTLWANYQYGGLDPVGYHVVNIVIHIINSVLVFLLSFQLIRYFSPKDDATTNTQNMLWAMLICVIWALHPLNSQAVTYVVQRLASIVSVFYLLSIMTYIKLRQQPFGLKMMVYGGLFAVLVIAGFHAKQNYAAVFLFLICWEFMICTVKMRRFLLGTMMVGGTLLLLISPFITSFWQALDSFTRDPGAAARGDYFYTQLVVLWDYIGRFIYPGSLQLNIDIPLRTSLEPLVAMTFVLHILVMTVAFKLRKKIPLLLIGVLLFYTSHTVESLFIPIKDLAFEHRTYIGNIGLALAFVALLKFWMSSNSNQKLSVGVVSGLCIVLLAGAVVTFERNTLWQRPLDFYANEVRLAPQKARANASYGIELMKLERYDEAEGYLKQSVDRNLLERKITASGLTAYMTVLYHQKKYQQASRSAMLGLKHIKEPLERSALLGNLAFGYIQMGYCDFAKGLLQTALKLDANNASAQTNLDHCLAKLKSQSQQKGG